MPRRKKSEEGQEGAPESPTWVEGLPDDVWELGKSIGNVSLARDIIDVASGARPPRDSAEISRLVKASSAHHQKTMNRYISLREGIGAKLRTHYDRFQTAKGRTDNLTRLFSDPRALVNGRQNGDAGASVQSDESGHDSE